MHKRYTYESDLDICCNKGLLQQMTCQKYVTYFVDEGYKTCGAPSISGYPLCKMHFVSTRSVIHQKFAFSRRKDIQCCFFEDVPLAIKRSDTPHEDLIKEKMLRDYTYEYFLVGGYKYIDKNEKREATIEEQELATKYHIKVMVHA